MFLETQCVDDGLRGGGFRGLGGVGVGGLEAGGGVGDGGHFGKMGGDGLKRSGIVSSVVLQAGV